MPYRIVFSILLWTILFNEGTNWLGRKRARKPYIVFTTSIAVSDRLILIIRNRKICIHSPEAPFLVWYINLGSHYQLNKPNNNLYYVQVSAMRSKWKQDETQTLIKCHSYFCSTEATEIFGEVDIEQSTMLKLDSKSTAFRSPTLFFFFEKFG